ncbi:hypothetical protein [Streptoalloteichus hindustanus]|uniref:Uncharacterized protein n=1 Tax=Streptoalloteichus hindustanus TaxID=2017 RepID=A0A1M5AGD0_STRHI|nr:hypothetical protein [Streptoalloteichus hindustanus]SHF29350.1 hypothetical protein SAMN05444320_103107 [Streptoalloteichus hindustanus]
MPWSYWHRIELYRIDRGQRVLMRSQEVDDHGPYVCRGVEEWAQIVAEDYLWRWELPHGRWLVVVWRLGSGKGQLDKPEKLCEVQFTWTGSPETSTTGQGLAGSL